MKNSTLKTVSFIAVVFAGSTVFAQAAWDTDGDGAYSFDEMLAAVPAMTAESFAAIDLDADGVINAEEMDAATQSGLIVVDG